MKRVIAVILTMVLVVITAMPTTVIADPIDEVPQRIKNGVTFVPLRLMAYAYGATVDWNGETRTAHITFANGEMRSFQVDALVNDVGGFIEPPGITWIPLDVAIELFSITSTEKLIVTSFLDRLAAGDVAGATMMMSTEMQQAIDFTMGLFMPRGDITDFAIIDHSYMVGLYHFDVAITHIMGTGLSRISINDNGEIVMLAPLGFTFEPIPHPENYKFTAETIIVGEETDWPLDGILTMPNNASADNPVPAVILVHGSGPYNMDLSTFNNRPFFDIAEYLSSNGIAVLRYNKRTFVHGVAFAQAFGNFGTAWEETIEDAILAAELLRADARIGDIFVLGHSLGAVLTPRIVEEGNLDGGIMFGSSPRAIYEIQYDQNVQAITQILDDWVTAGIVPIEQADALMAESLVALAEMMELARSMPNMTEAELAETMVFAISAAWQLSVVESLPQIFIARNTAPILILHGDRDFQVFTEQDFNVLVQYTQGMAHVQTILYENVNHIFMQSQTPYNDFRDYMPVGRVYEQILRDIVYWINSIVNP